uniref:Uncharacterized protein n=1 Tax=Globisporangium ultimum (strain ATCC 200006 / CBS 805.95 / DAOM BR144) TaxID=431595 RepID=K3WH55_GLOUD
MADAASYEDHLVWFAFFCTIYVAFYFFTSPFVGNPELLNSWTPYVYLSMGLYGWLVAAAALHIPVTSLGTLGATIKQPSMVHNLMLNNLCGYACVKITLLFPFFSVSFVFLVVLELLMVLFLSRITKKLGLPWRVANVTLLRSFMNVLRNSAGISVACVALIVHCDATLEGDSDTLTYNRHACEKVFKFSNSEMDTVVPASYRGALLIWFAGMVLAITNFVLERISGIQMISFHWLVDRQEEAEEPIPSEQLHEKLPHNHQLPMVPWYSMFLFDTAFELLISLKVFLGRFDQRAMQKTLYPDEKDYMFDHLADRKDVWLDFMADCGDGFNSSYQIARLLAQPTLEVDYEVQEPHPRKKNKTITKIAKRVFPRGEALVIGGDLAYPHPEPESYEKRLWRCFEYAMKPPAHYDPAAISTAKVHLPDNCENLRDYKGPSVFAIPGNHDWFDGLNTFTRFICQRDWLGGWFLPQKTSHFCLKLPHGWWLFGVDLALEDDVNTEQFSVFKNIVETQMQEDDQVIVVTHEPRWLLDVYEQRDKSEEKLSFLINNILKDRVALRLAGDIHNYTRHTFKQEVAKPAPQSVKLPPAPPRMASPRPPSSILRRRPSFTRQVILSPTRKHFPHMYEDDEPESPQVGAAPTVPILPRVEENPTSTNVRPRVAEHLIVSGGGGAFLHPTHAPNCKTLKANGAIYEQKKCYPPVHVSRRYALLNVFGFRRINWRFDIVGGLAYFAMVLSMFPRCSVSSIYASATWQDAATQFIQELVEVQVEMVTTSYVSLLTFVMMVATLIVFADCTSLPKKCITGILISCLHCLAAFTILLVFECILEIATVRGTLGREGSHSLYDYFSSTLPDFSRLAPYDVFHIAHLFAEFMKLCMTIFDVPEVIAIHRIKICESGFATLSRTEQWTYYVSVFPYFWVLATPVVGAVFGLYLYIALNVFECHYNEAFSSLRISSYKNFLRLHFQPNGDLEVFAFGIDKMPRKWCRDPNWSGGTHMTPENQLPSHQWRLPSYWKPVVTKVDSMLRFDFENPSFDIKFNTTDRSNVHLIDRVLIQKRRPSSEQEESESEPTSRD